MTKTDLSSRYQQRLLAEAIAEPLAEAILSKLPHLASASQPAAEQDSGQVAGLEVRARELLAAEYARDGIDYVAYCIRNDAMVTGYEQRAIRAIAAALSAPPAAGAVPEGYALVPVDPTEAMRRAGAAEIGRQATATNRASWAWDAMLAARVQGGQP